MVEEKEIYKGVRSRKLYIWLISAAAVLVIYLLYNLISRTPPIEIDAGAEFADTVAESSTDEFDSEIGMVGDVGVGTIRKARYTHLNAEKQVDREFGFEKLLHAEGDEWEIEKPYMNMYRHNFKCYMTADKGKVRVEDAVGRATPKDATLSGNVKIHILPEKNSNVEESFIYLDDIVFISESSQFLSPGPVKFVSKNAQMLGKGLEIVYNDELGSLEFLKIIELETLRIRQPSKASLFSSQVSHSESPTGSGSRAQGRTPAEDRQVSRGGEIERGKGDYYRCVFRNDVTIDSPEQLVLADQVSINNILWAKGSGRKSETGGTSGTDKTEATVEVVEESIAPTRGEPREPSEQFVDIVVTCDNGITIVPMDSSGMSEDAATGNRGLRSFNDEKGRPTFIARRIDYCLVTENTVASGPLELTFYVNDVVDAEEKSHSSGTGRSGRTTFPVKVTAKEKAEFLPVLSQAVFEGDVLCAMLREETDFQQKYKLAAPKLVVELSKEKESRAYIKHLTASGKLVQLDTSKWAEGELIGFTKLKCLQFDYDAGQQMFSAAGSGIIAVDNSRVAEPGKKVGKFSLRRPCYAVVRNFDTLKYFSEANIIIADAAAEQILIDYFPIVKDEYGQQTSATANHIEAVFSETAGGHTELSKLDARGGITYEEEGKKKIWGKGKDIQFVGSEMFYDGGKSMVTAWGDESQPCFLNGALAPGIEYDLKTGRIKTKIVGPGMLHLER